MKIHVPLLTAVIALNTVAGLSRAGELDKIQRPGPVAVERSLPFRALLISYGDPRNENAPFWKNNSLLRQYSDIARSHYNAAIWIGFNELHPPAPHTLLRLEEFPEARELSSEQNEKIIAQAQWMFQQAKKAGLNNFLYTQVIWFTEAFAKAHGLDKPLPRSETVSWYHLTNYGHTYPQAKCGVRNKATRAYVESVFAEFPRLYPNLDGFYSPIGEPLPGDRSTFFREAIAPGLKRSGRRPIIIAHQWQVPLEDYVANIVPEEVYDNTWLGFHASNGEQLTDAKPWPGIVEWAETTCLPTVPAILPGNIGSLPFNSPRFAWEIIHEMRKIREVVGFFYWPHCMRESRFFKEALGLYAKTGEPYSDQPWRDYLEEQFGDRNAAQHFLNAYNISAKIVPEMCALVNHCGIGDRCFHLPYSLLTPSSRAARVTSPAHGKQLVPVTYYAQIAAGNPILKNYLKDNPDADYTLYPHTIQTAGWASHGGAIYDIIPPRHMNKVRRMGQQCLLEAEAGLKTVQKNKPTAQELYQWMKAYQLFSVYYERKVAAAAAAMIYHHSHQPADKTQAEQIADEALRAYTETAHFLQANLTPKYSFAYYQAGKTHDLAGIIELEKQERKNLAQIFAWPQ